MQWRIRRLVAQLMHVPVRGPQIKSQASTDVPTKRGVSSYSRSQPMPLLSNEQLRKAHTRRQREVGTLQKQPNNTRQQSTTKQHGENFSLNF